MKCYCGTDIIEVERVKEAILSTSSFRNKIFTAKEISIADIKGDAIKYQHYAGRFAAKEAIYKALSNVTSSIDFLDIEVVNDSENKNRPVVNIYQKELNELITNKKLLIDVSISHIKDCAIASAVATLV